MSSSTATSRILAGILLAATALAGERVPAGAGIPYTVQAGDTLSGIARKVYGDEAFRRNIAEANPGIDPVRLKAGTILILPEIPAEDPVSPPPPAPRSTTPPEDVPAPRPAKAPSPEPVPEEDVAACLEAFRSGVEPDCTEAREALRRRGASVLPALLDADRNNPPSSVRRHLAWVLGALGDPSAAVPLAARLEDVSAEVRLEACRALGKLKASAASAKLRDLLKDGTTRVREEAARALGRIGDPDAVEPLAALLTDWRKEQPGAVRSAAAEALGRIGSPTCRGPLVAALKDSEARVRRAAIGGLIALTRGVDRCYDPDAPEADRAAALKSWEEWLSDARD